ncbi:MAG: hydroxyacid dehydrogenase [Saprospiraceae bacterium]|nr:hydroxyacid dehydrogenase [Saprospiraceae bacterium]
MKTVLITDDVHPLLLSGLENRGFVCDYRPNITLQECRDQVADYYGLVINSKIKADKSFLEQARSLKFIARLGSGLEIIDLATAEAKGILVLSAPEGNCNAVAEHAVGMLLSLLNNLNQADREVRQFQWNREKNRGYELRGKTIGIIGFGHTGEAFAQKLSGFGVQVLAFDRFNTIHTNLKHVKICDLKTIQNQADIISLHVSLNASSVHMINRLFIEQCSKPFILINTARGQAVKIEDLLWGLENGKISGACLDVFENEKPETFTALEKDLYSYLYRMNQVMLSPHVAGWTFESKALIAEVLLKKLDMHKNSL